MQIQTAIEQIKTIKYVTDARLWDKVTGKERIYIETQKHNGGRNWNGGLGYRTCYVDLATKQLMIGGEAGAATREALKPTLEQIKQIAAQIDLA